LQRGDEKIVVQAKRYQGTVGIKAVQEAVGAIKQYNCDRAMVVTNSYFSQEARTLANANGVKLWDRNELAKRLLALKEETPVKREATAPPLGATSPVCVQCGKVVSVKVRDYCLDHAAAFGGRIYCYEHQKEVRHQVRNR
jgi:restriction system protein